jgi:hypothetical protein
MGRRVVGRDHGWAARTVRRLDRVKRRHLFAEFVTQDMVNCGSKCSSLLDFLSVATYSGSHEYAGQSEARLSRWRNY